ncbi:hypothetical protein V8C86DRAFT_2576973 [Haematococcus lacustris]
MGKRRRCEVDVDAERTLHSSFVVAANSISQLYTQAVQQQRRSSAAASRLTLERVLAFLLKEHAGSDVVPKADLVQFLQQEYEGVEGSEHLPHQFPVQFMPVHASSEGGQAHSGSPEECAPEVLTRQRPTSGASSMLSPGRRGPAGMAAMETAEVHPHQANYHNFLHQSYGGC